VILIWMAPSTSVISSDCPRTSALVNSGATATRGEVVQQVSPTSFRFPMTSETRSLPSRHLRVTFPNR